MALKYFNYFLFTSFTPVLALIFNATLQVTVSVAPEANFSLNELLGVTNMNSADDSS